MKNHVYKIIELTGTSITSIEDARNPHTRLPAPLFTPGLSTTRNRRQNLWILRETVRGLKR